jgi:hypothetical protein
MGRDSRLVSYGAALKSTVGITIMPSFRSNILMGVACKSLANGTTVLPE